MTKVSNGKNVEANEPHWIEWVTGAIAAMIVLAVIAWIGKDALMDSDTSPKLTVNVLQTEKRGDGFQVSFEIQNDSSATASQVNIQGEIGAGSATERVETTLDYVPGHSKARGGMIFRQNPEGKSLVVRATSFSEP